MPETRPKFFSQSWFYALSEWINFTFSLHQIQDDQEQASNLQSVHCAVEQLPPAAASTEHQALLIPVAEYERQTNFILRQRRIVVHFELLNIKTEETFSQLLNQAFSRQDIGTQKLCE